MSLVITEIHTLRGLAKTCIVFAADRRISRGGVYIGTRKKIFQIPFLPGGVGYFGLAEVPARTASLPMSDWLHRFMNQNNAIKDMKTFASQLAAALNADVPLRYRSRYVSGLHVCGYNDSNLPEFWFVSNVKDDGVTVTGNFSPREEFLRRDAKQLGFNGTDPKTARSGAVQIYRNGDIRAHIAAWGKIDDAFGVLFGQSGFRRLRSMEDYKEWVRFKMEVIALFYKKYCNVSLIARPIDAFLIQRNV